MKWNLSVGNMTDVVENAGQCHLKWRVLNGKFS